MGPKRPAVKVVSWKESSSQLWRLAILEPLGSKLTSVAHLKALIILYWNIDGPEAWQNSYYGPCPLENGRFTPKNGYCAVYSEYSCIISLRDFNRLTDIWHRDFTLKIKMADFDCPLPKVWKKYQLCWSCRYLNYSLKFLVPVLGKSMPKII